MKIATLLIVVIAFAGQAMAQTNTFPTTGNAGIGTTSPGVLLDIRGTGSALLNSSPFLKILDTRSVSGGIGGTLTFGGTYNGTTLTDWAHIASGKDNSTSGEYGGHLVLGTRPHGSGIMEVMRLTSGGDVGIGTSTPNTRLSVLNPSSGSRFAAASFYEDRAIAAGIGGNITFGGRYTGSTLTEWAAVGGIKDNATDGDNGGSLGLYTRANGGGMIEAMRLTSYGKIGIGMTVPDAKLSILNPSTAGRFATASFYEDRAVAIGIGANISFGGRYTGTSITEWAGVGGIKENSTDGNYSGSLGFYTRAQDSSMKEVMRVTSYGKIGIGVTVPDAKLSILNPSSASRFSTASFYEDRAVAAGVGANITFGGRYSGSTVTEWAGVGGIKENGTDGNYAGSLGLYTRAQGGNLEEGMRMTSAGKIGIGTSNPTEKLSVNGNISANGNVITRKLIVTQTGWSDYVFDEDYKLRNLQSLEDFIAKNKHLPEIPSAKEVEAKGINVGDNQALLLKKIEELTLYVIGLSKQNREQQLQIDGQSKEIQQLKKR